MLDVEHDPDEVAAWAAGADIGTGVLTPVGVIDPARLSQHGRLDLLVAMERLKSWADAQQQRTLALLATHPAPIPNTSEGQSKQWVREEVACALRLSFGTAAARLHAATELSTRLPATLDALERGELTPLHARVLADAVTVLDERAASAVEARVLLRAGSQTVVEFKRSVKRAVLTVDTRGQAEKHQRAVEDRRVELFAGEDGMASLWALLPADSAAAVMGTLDDCVTGDDERSADQQRADALIDLLTRTNTPGPSPEPGNAEPGDSAGHASIGPAVQVSVALSTLLGLDDQPGELAGYGPIPAALARAIAADPTGTWRRLVTDRHGRCLDYGRTRYRPPTNLRDFVIARDRTCRMISCNRRADRSELDHITAWEDGGTTNPANLHPLCPRHHHAKHQAGWHVQRDDDTGATEWTSPTGRRYQKPPDPYPIDTTLDPPPAPHDEAPPF